MLCFFLTHNRTQSFTGPLRCEANPREERSLRGASLVGVLLRVDQRHLNLAVTQKRSGTHSGKLKKPRTSPGHG